MVFNLRELMAKRWGVEVDSPEFRRRRAEQRERARHTKIEIVPCGPACASCGDNSYACGCQKNSQD